MTDREMFNNAKQSYEKTRKLWREFGLPLPTPDNDSVWRLLELAECEVSRRERLCKVCGYDHGTLTHEDASNAQAN